MARTISEIKREMTDSWMSDPVISSRYNLDANLTFEQQFSKVSIESLLFYAIAFSINVFEKILDVFKSDIEQTVLDLKPHTILWYINKIKAFQLGDLLQPDSDVYETIDETKQIIKYCSITDLRGYLFIKVAKQQYDNPVPISTEELAQLNTYIGRVKDAGVHYELISRLADRFRVELLIHYDPLTDITQDQVKDVIRQYLASMPFDGVYSNMGLVDRLQQLPGVKVAEVRIAQAAYGTNSYETIVSIYSPDAGYMFLNEADSIIELKPYGYDS